MANLNDLATVWIRDALEFPSQEYIRQVIRKQKLERQSKDVLKANREKYEVRKHDEVLAEQAPTRVITGDAMQKMERARTLLCVLSMLLASSVACGLSKEATPTQTREPAGPPTAVAPTIMLALPDPAWGATTTWFVVSSTADIHACASADCAIIETVSFGKRLAVLETVDNWHKVRLAAGKHGWIEADLTSQSAVCKSCE